MRDISDQYLRVKVDPHKINNTGVILLYIKNNRKNTFFRDHILQTCKQNYCVQQAPNDIEVILLLSATNRPICIGCKIYENRQKNAKNAILKVYSTVQATIISAYEVTGAGIRTVPMTKNALTTR